MWAHWLHNPYCLGGFEIARESKAYTNLPVSRAQTLANCLQNSCCLRVHLRGDKVICGSIASWGHTHGRIEYLSLTILEVSKVRTEPKLATQNVLY